MFQGICYSHMTKLWYHILEAEGTVPRHTDIKWILTPSFTIIVDDPPYMNTTGSHWSYWNLGEGFGNLCVNTFPTQPYKSDLLFSQFSTWRGCSIFSFSIRTALILYHSEYTYIILPWKVWKISDSSKDNFSALKPCSELRKIKAIQTYIIVFPYFQSQRRHKNFHFIWLCIALLSSQIGLCMFWYGVVDMYNSFNITRVSRCWKKGFKF